MQVSKIYTGGKPSLEVWKFWKNWKKSFFSKWNGLILFSSRFYGLIHSFRVHLNDPRDGSRYSSNLVNKRHPNIYIYGWFQQFFKIGEKVGQPILPAIFSRVGYVKRSLLPPAEFFLRLYICIYIFSKGWKMAFFGLFSKIHSSANF